MNTIATICPSFIPCLSYNVITKIEQGAAKNPNIQTILKLADAFGISLDELIGRKRNNIPVRK